VGHDWQREYWLVSRLVFVVCAVSFTDDDTENDPTRQVDEAEDEDDGDREAKWRTERLEREKFLEAHKVHTLVAVFTEILT